MTDIINRIKDKFFISNNQKNTLFFRDNTHDEDIFRSVVNDNEYRLPDKFDHKDIIIDIGAHIGSFTYTCLERGAKNIHSYEAERENYGSSQKNLKLDIERGYVNLYNLAVFRSDIPEDKMLITHSTIDRKNTGGISVIWHGNKEMYSYGKVCTIGLDRILEKFKKVKLMKIDCEGSEYPILLTSKMLDRIEYICGEYHNTGEYHNPIEKNAIIDGKVNYNWKDLEKLFVGLGYRCIFVENKDNTKVGLFFAERRECPEFFTKNYKK